MFEENNTVYAVMENPGGIPLQQWLDERPSPVSAETARNMLQPVFDGVAAMHQVGLVHRGICPENIRVLENGRARLTGYATVGLRTAGSGLHEQLYEGYSAPEQYSTTEFEGRYTDEYSLAAVVYRMVCGQSPVPAAQRLVSDSNPRARTLERAVPEYVSDVLWMGLQLGPAERIQTVPQLFRALSSQEYTTELTQTLQQAAPRPQSTEEEERKKHILSLRNLLAAFGLSVLAILMGTVLTLLLTARQKDSRTPIFRFACVFSNAAYMGFPLISALFGAEGLLYASAYVTVFNILLWTMGYGMVSGSNSPKAIARSLLHTPVLYAMVVGLSIYLLQIPVPSLIAQPLELLGGMNTPLSMLITGILIAAGDVRSIVTDKHIWKLAGVRMLLIPAVCLAAFAVLGLLRFGMSAQVVLLLECCPAAAITSVFAVQFGHDEHFAAGSVVLTTLLSILILPLCALVLTALM